MPMTSSICSLDAVGLGGGEVDLVEDGDDLVAGVDRLVDVGERLRLDALAGVDDEERALDGAHRAGDLVGEVDVAGGVDEVEDVGLAVASRVYSRRTVWALMVMPRSRSMSMESSSCSFMSRSATVPVDWISRSASVDLPWSMWATMEKLRMCAVSVIGLSGGFAG